MRHLRPWLRARNQNCTSRAKPRRKRFLFKNEACIVMKTWNLTPAEENSDNASHLEARNKQWALFSHLSPHYRPTKYLHSHMNSCYFAYTNVQSQGCILPLFGGLSPLRALVESTSSYDILRGKHATQWILYGKAWALGCMSRESC